MTEWYIIVPVVAVLVQGSIAIFIAWYGQNVLARKIEEQRHHLIKERFLAEKRWEEAKSLYYDVSKVCIEISSCMREIFISISFLGKSMHPLSGIYILVKILGIDQEGIFQPKDATESERLQIATLDQLLHLDRFHKLFDILSDMEGHVAIFASNQVREMFYLLLKIAGSFSTHLGNELNFIIAESLEKTGSLAEDSALEVFNEFFRSMEQTGKEEIEFPEQLDTGSVVADFSEALKQMHKQMKKELIEGIELNEG